MKNERVLLVDDDKNYRDLLPHSIEKNGHQVVGVASSVREVKELLETGIKPTVALVDGLAGRGEIAAQLIRKYLPETKIIAFAGQRENFGDEYWEKGMAPQELIRLLVELQH